MGRLTTEYTTTLSSARFCLLINFFCESSSDDSADCKVYVNVLVPVCYCFHSHSLHRDLYGGHAT